jgi:hypothetical protein
VLQYRYGLTDVLTPDKFAAVYMFSSTNGGESFDPNGVQVGTLPFSDAVRGPDLETKEGVPVAGVSLTTHAVTEGELYQRVLVSGPPARSFVNLSKDHPYNGALGMVDEKTPLVVFTGLDGETQFKRYLGANDPNTEAGWPKDAKTIEPKADWIHLAGGPSGLFMLDTNTENRVEVRKFDGAAFGPGITRPDWTGESPQDHLAQDDGGMLHVLLPQITASCCPLLYSFSGDGTSWKSVSYPMPSLAGQVRSDFLANHHGIAVFHSGTGTSSTVYALRLGPPVALALPPAGKAPAKAKISGGKVVVKIKGKLKVPDGIAAVDVCAGKLVATVRKGSKKLAERGMRLRPDCSFSARVSVPKSKVGASKALGLQLKLRKSRTAKAAKRNYKIEVRR